ncbi:MAG: hypothetical protein HKN68_18310 [Saprospiraceae bacterium]|nr:hypothetical protein [Saprospiraceae bacterium]
MGSKLLSQQLIDRLEGKENFKEVKEIAERYYQEINEGKIQKNPNDLKYKHWKRWEWYAQDRLDKKGDLVNTGRNNINALIDEKRRYRDTERTTNSFWTFTGPDSNPSSPTSHHYIGLGRVDRIAFHPSNPNIIYIGTPAGGIWKTMDGGVTWIPLDDFLPSLGVSGIAISKTNPNLIYALTGCGDGGGVSSSSGVLKSIDGGETWIKTGELYSGAYSGYMLTMDPNNDQVLFAATNRGLYKTSNGGSSWTRVLSTSTIYDVKFKPGSSDSLYACGRTSVYYSYYGGDQSEWSISAYDISPSIVGRKAIAVTPADPERIYLFTGPHTGVGTFSGFYTSINGGMNYTRAANSPNILGGESGMDNNSQSSYDFCIAASTQQSNVVVVGGLIVWRSINYGAGWTNSTTFGTGSSSPGYVHPDVHAVEFNPLNDYLYAATDGGFYRSTDLGFNWTNLSEGIGTAQFYHMAGTSVNNNYVLCGAQDNGTKYRKNNTTSFDHVAGTDGFSVQFYPGDPSRFLCSFNGSLVKFWNYGADNGNLTPKFHWFMELAIHNTNKDIIFAGTNDGGGRLYKSINEGVSWDTTFILAGASVMTCPSNNDRIYVAGGSEIRRSDDLGGIFTTLHDKPGFPYMPPSITDIAVHPYNSSNVYITFGGYEAGTKVYTSIDGGLSWENISGTLPDVPANCIDVNINGDLYLGTDIGVYYKSLGSSDWIPFKNGLPSTIVTDFYINNNISVIRASTFGRGVWTSLLADGNCVNDLVWSTITTLNGYQYFEANNKIENKSIIDGGIGTNVFFKAGQFIDLKPGFHAKDDGIIFQAQLGPCNSGGVPSAKIQNHQHKKE